MEPDFRLDGKVTLMTGATGGIGYDSCLALAQMGSDIGILYFKDQQRTEDLAADVRKLGRQAYLIEQDLERTGLLQGVVERFVQDAGHIDILVSVAGVADLVAYKDVTISQMERTYRINTMVLFFLAQQIAVKFMVAQRGAGRVIL